MPQVLGSSGVQVTLLTPHRSQVLFSWRGDLYLDFFEVSWVRGGKVVAVESCGSPEIRRAYEVSSGNELAFTSIKDDVSRSIRDRYGTAADGFENLRCPCSERLHQAFVLRHRLSGAL